MHLWVVDEVKQPDIDSRNRTFPMVVASHELKANPDDDEWDARTSERRVSAGSFQVIVCAACGYTEWYAYNLDNLAQIPGARLVGPTSGGNGPYR